MARLAAYDWPGNIRELENIMERMAILSSGPIAELADLPPEISGAPLGRDPVAADGKPSDDEGEMLTLQEVERRHIVRTLERNGWNQSRTARDLGLKRGTLIYRMQKLGISPGPDAKG
jgi:DNA-binding NtrC family response regulator